MSRYAPPRESDGLKAYVVTRHSFGRSTDRIEWAESLKDAKARHGWTRELHVSYTVRRATPADLTRDGADR